MDMTITVFWDVMSCNLLGGSKCRQDDWMLNVLLLFPSTQYRYTIRFYIYCMSQPDVAIFKYIRSHNHLFIFLLLPYTGQCLHMGSALYVWFYVMPHVSKHIKYRIYIILKIFSFGMFKLGLKLRLTLGWR
jgi:hypothetical protein